jgi:hypothetical protein
VEDLGFSFWLKLVAVVVGAGIAAFVAFLLFDLAFYAWGFLGAFLVVAAGLLVFAWFYDRRHQREEY